MEDTVQLLRDLNWNKFLWVELNGVDVNVRDVKSAALETILNKSGLAGAVLTVHENIWSWLDQSQESVNVVDSVHPFILLNVLELGELLLILLLYNFISDVSDVSGPVLIISLHFEDLLCEINIIFE